MTSPAGTDVQSTTKRVVNARARIVNVFGFPPATSFNLRPQQLAEKRSRSAWTEFGSACASDLFLVQRVAQMIQSRFGEPGSAESQGEISPLHGGLSAPRPKRISELIAECGSNQIYENPGYVLGCIHAP